MVAKIRQLAGLEHATPSIFGSLTHPTSTAIITAKKTREIHTITTARPQYL
jgi:hypothetical protein